MVGPKSYKRNCTLLHEVILGTKLEKNKTKKKLVSGTELNMPKK